MSERPKKQAIAYPIGKRLVIKAIGSMEHISAFIEAIEKIYPSESLNFSPILKNSMAEGYHCFINVLMPKSPLQSLEHTRGRRPKPLPQTSHELC